MMDAKAAGGDARMVNSLMTRSSLLVRLRDAGDQEAWAQCLRLYTPLVYSYARRHGLQDADGADLAQDVMRALLDAGGRLEEIHRKGSLRSWLFTVAHHKLYDLQARLHKQARGTGETGVHAALEEQPARDEEERWDEEYRQRLFAWAADEVRARCSPNAWEAFWQTAVAGKPAAEVAAALGMTVAAVYLARSRVMARLKEQIREWEDDA
jgi:RNA polymerase sigma-70 factor (ECF subfamily)